MHYQFEVSAPPMPAVEVPATPPPNVTDLLREILEVQREQLNLSRAVAVAQDSGVRWRAFAARWQGDFPGLAESCRGVLPALERAYAELIADLTRHLEDLDSDALENEFTLNEFLDRYGMRLGQLGTIVNLVTPLAEAAVPPEAG